MWNFISSAIGALAQNANTQSAINANKESQAENREWNLNLAKMQNQMEKYTAHCTGCLSHTHTHTHTQKKK